MTEGMHARRRAGDQAGRQAVGGPTDRQRRKETDTTGSGRYKHFLPPPKPTFLCCAQHHKRSEGKLIILDETCNLTYFSYMFLSIPYQTAQKQYTNKNKYFATKNNRRGQRIDPRQGGLQQPSTFLHHFHSCPSNM